MHPEKKDHKQIKTELHPRNKHRGRYNFDTLIPCYPKLADYVFLNKYNDFSIDFSNPEAVKALNSALLKYSFGIAFWNIPDGYLCPPIPGRADYIHYAADLLAEDNQGKIPANNRVKCLDIGVGANCIYPILGVKEYGWSFVGSDIDRVAVDSANQIIQSDNSLKEHLEIRFQPMENKIFKGIIQETERFAITICNPPFHASHEEAQWGTTRKIKNLKGIKTTQPVLNFGGQNHELWCEGGEKQFVRNMIFQSREFANSCLWFTSLISKEANLNAVFAALKKVHPAEIKTINMGQGNKKSRIVAWSFMAAEQRKNWFQALFSI